MPYKDKVLQRKAVKEAVQRHRVLQEGMTDPQDVIPEHPIMKYLIPGEDRKKMEAIVQSLKEHHQVKNVYLGYPNLGGIPLDIVSEMLECTRR